MTIKKKGNTRGHAGAKKLKLSKETLKDLGAVGAERVKGGRRPQNSDFCGTDVTCSDQGCE